MSEIDFSIKSVVVGFDYIEQTSDLVDIIIVRNMDGLIIKFRALSKEGGQTLCEIDLIQGTIVTSKHKLKLSFLGFISWKMNGEPAISDRCAEFLKTYHHFRVLDSILNDSGVSFNSEDPEE